MSTAPMKLALPLFALAASVLSLGCNESLPSYAERPVYDRLRGLFADLVRREGVPICEGVE